MKKSMAVILILATMAFPALSMAQKVKISELPIPKTVSPFNHKIISRSSAQLSHSTTNKTHYKVYYIAQWGLHRFEYGVFNFVCSQKNCQLKGEGERLAFYERCEGVSRSGKPLCDGLVSSNSGPTDDSSDNEDIRVTCELNPERCQRSNDIDGSDEPHVPNEDTLF